MSHFIAFVCLFAAGMTYALIRRYAGRRWQSWAGPAASALAWWGLDYAYAPPWWVTVAGFLGVCVLIHRFIRGKQEDVVERVGSAAVPGLPYTLQRAPAGKHVGVWEAVPPLDPPLVLTLDFIGTTEDQYELILWTTAEKPLPATVLLHHYDAPGEVQKLLPAGPVGGLPGQPGWMTVRSEPADYAFELLDFKTLDLVIGILNFRSRDREVYVFLQGRGLHVASTAVFGEGELRRLLGLAAALFHKARQPRPL